MSNKLNNGNGVDFSPKDIVLGVAVIVAVIAFVLSIVGAVQSSNNATQIANIHPPVEEQKLGEENPNGEQEAPEGMENPNGEQEALEEETPEPAGDIG